MDFPTPPFPLATPITFLTVAIASSASSERPSITFAVTFKSKFSMPSMSSIAFLTSASISSLNGQAGVVSSKVNLRSPEFNSKSLIIPIDTISFFKSGSTTVASFSNT